MPALSRGAFLLLICLLACAAPGQPGAQPADCPDPSRPSADLVEELLGWIEARTDYDVAAARAAPPEILFCQTGDSIEYEGNDILVEPGLRAAYDLTSQRIFLVLPWDPDDPRHVSALLHELVHHVQLLNRAWECPEATEWEAYDLQAQWLAENRIDPGFDWLWIYMISRCPRDIHP